MPQPPPKHHDLPPSKEVSSPEGLDEQPPIMGSWPRMYAFVLILHAVLIGVYYLISRLYA